MLNLLENKIIMQQGDNCSFRISVIDLAGEEVRLNLEDTVTMRVYKEGVGVVITKEANRVYDVVGDEDDIDFIFQFIPSDTNSLHYDNYFYDVVLEESSGNRYTIISKNVFCLAMSMQYADVNTVSATPQSAEPEYDTYDYGLTTQSNLETTPELSVEVSSESLIGRFSYITIERVSYDTGMNDLILF